MQKNFAEIFPFLRLWTFPTLEILEIAKVAVFNDKKKHKQYS